MRTAQLSASMALCAVLAATGPAGCGGPAGGPAQPEGDRSRPSSAAVGSASPPAPVPAGPSPAQVRANELGQIPVLMVHQVQPRAEGDYAQTPGQLRASLEYLAGHGYRPVTAAELVNRDLDLPAGTSPVVLTFDDGYPDQFRLRPDGSADPQSAVGVLQSVAARHPGFRPVGTIYLNRHPFGQADGARELRWLVAHGWEIGNHTSTHANLGALSPAAVQEEIADQHQAITRALPGYPVSTLALPFGVLPDNPVLAHRGRAGAVWYDYRGVMLVGAGPATSPFAAGWDPFHIPRIRSWHGRTDWDEDYWMPRLARTRYISDGDPAKVSFPRSAAASAPLAPAFAGRANPY